MSEPTETQRRFETFPGMNCFVCAPQRLNGSGLNLVFEETAEGAATTFTLPGHFQSYPGFLHGGVLSAIVDETMAYAGIFKFHVLPFTSNLQLSFHSGVSAMEPHRCTARIVERKGRRFTTEADLEGRVTAKAEFVIPTLAMAKKMMSASDLESFGDFFR